MMRRQNTLVSGAPIQSMLEIKSRISKYRALRAVGALSLRNYFDVEPARLGRRPSRRINNAIYQ
jgi:hypothetical protein